MSRLAALAVLAVGANALDNGVGLTPMMGWMTWLRFRRGLNCELDPDNCISENLIKSMADRMVEDGRKDLGYEYVSVYDCW